MTAPKELAATRLTTLFCSFCTFTLNQINTAVNPVCLQAVLNNRASTSFPEMWVESRYKESRQQTGSNV